MLESYSVWQDVHAVRNVGTEVESGFMLSPDFCSLSGTVCGISGGTSIFNFLSLFCRHIYLYSLKLNVCVMRLYYTSELAYNISS
jgi:hypothetical protein